MASDIADFAGAPDVRLTHSCPEGQVIRKSAPAIIVQRNGCDMSTFVAPFVG